jgi:hypothetical protein
MTLAVQRAAKAHRLTIRPTREGPLTYLSLEAIFCVFFHDVKGNSRFFCCVVYRRKDQLKEVVT